MTDPLRFFIGFDSREPVAWHVFAHSILRRATVPVSLVPLVQSQLRAQGLYTRLRGGTESTEFSMTRFLVPHLCDYRGISIFADCDMLCLADVADLLPEIEKMQDRGDAVSVVQHHYTPAPGLKMDGQVQTVYPRKNWTSFMIFDAARCRGLAPGYVNNASGLELHRLLWLKDEQIGSLDPVWNWLVEELPPNPAAKILHYTLGGPWFRDHANCSRAEDWRNEWRAAFDPPLDQWGQDAWTRLADRTQPEPVLVVK